MTELGISGENTEPPETYSSERKKAIEDKGPMIWKALGLLDGLLSAK